MNKTLSSASPMSFRASAPSHWALNKLPEHERLTHLNYHLKTGDYFAVLATIFGFIEEELDEIPEHENSALTPSLMRCIRKDLEFAQAHCRIVDKN